LRFQKAKQENLVREQENRAYEARKRLHEAPKRSSQLESGNLPHGSGTTQANTSGANSVMDNLLEKLKAAGPSGDSRTARRRAAARRNMNEQKKILMLQSAAQGETIKEEKEEEVIASNNGEDKVETAAQRVDGEPSLAGASGFMGTLSDPIMLDEESSSDQPSRVSTTVPAETKASGSQTSSPSAAATMESDDVAGRARQLLKELRSSNSDYSSFTGTNRQSSSSLNSNGGGGSSKLAERRARKAQQLKTRTSQGSFDYTHNSKNLSLSPSETAEMELPSPQTEAHTVPI
jgi:cytokinesis protein